MLHLRSIVVTGAAGFIGSHLCERLVADGYDVHGIDDFSHGDPLNLTPVQGSAAFRFTRGDCRDARLMRRLMREADAVIHLASEKIPRYGGATQTLEANTAGARTVFEAAQAAEARVVFASTSDVYGNGTPPFAEDDNLALGPSTTRRWAYATSKLYNEHLALAMHAESGLDAVVLRLFGSYGPRNHPSWWGGPQAAFIERLLDGGTIEIHGDGEQIRTFTYVADTVDGFVRALASPLASGEVINVGGNQPVTILELAAFVHEAMGLHGPLRAVFVPYEQLPGRYQDVRRRIPNNSKAAELLDFKARTDLATGLRATVAWHIERRAAERPVSRRSKAVAAI